MSLWLLNPINHTGHEFLMELGHHMTTISWDPRETAQLFQRLSICSQRFNTIAFRRTFAQSTAAHKRWLLFHNNNFNLTRYQILRNFRHNNNNNNNKNKIIIRWWLTSQTSYLLQDSANLVWHQAAALETRPQTYFFNFPRFYLFLKCSWLGCHSWQWTDLFWSHNLF